uniref:Uncharacterized protein n=1 Tax=viral metagenome TaxID=1070528 RepID=A0A6C0KBX5_9ZZZZ
MISKFLKSPEASAFIIVFVLFVMLSPGMVVKIDSTDPRQWRNEEGADHVKLESAVEAILSMVGNSSNVGAPAAQVTEITAVLIHAFVAAMLAGALVNMAPTKLTKGLPIFKNL